MALWRCGVVACMCQPGFLTIDSRHVISSRSYLPYVLARDELFAKGGTELSVRQIANVVSLIAALEGADP